MRDRRVSVQKLVGQRPFWAYRTPVLCMAAVFDDRELLEISQGRC